MLRRSVRPQRLLDRTGTRFPVFGPVSESDRSRQRRELPGANPAQIHQHRIAPKPSPKRSQRRLAAGKELREQSRHRDERRPHPGDPPPKPLSRGLLGNGLPVIGKYLRRPHNIRGPVDISLRLIDRHRRFDLRQGPWNMRCRKIRYQSKCRLSFGAVAPSNAM